MEHRDSVGNHGVIGPGGVQVGRNTLASPRAVSRTVRQRPPPLLARCVLLLLAQWMTAGRGIIHSEMPKVTDGDLHGFQLW